MSVPTPALEEWPPIKMYDMDFRKELQIMHRVIGELGYWDKMKLDPGTGGYMWSKEKFIDDIYTHPDVSECGHSGATQAFALRYMQYIALNGWDSFCEKFSGKNKGMEKN